MSLHTSKTLLMLLQEQGEEADWQRFAGLYTPFIVNTVRSQGVGLEDSRDLAQDVLFKVWRALPKFLYLPERCRFRTWLSKICKNTAINHLKRKSTQQQKSHLLDSEAALLALSTPSPNDELAEREWRLFLTEQAWEEIQGRIPQLKLDVYAAFLEGQAPSEVANRFDLQENTALRYRKIVQDHMALEVKRLSQQLDG